MKELISQIPNHLKYRKTFLSAKYNSMLLGGTIMALQTCVRIMADTVVAGILIGEDAVTGVNLVLPLYSFANFLSMVFSLGVPILYANEIGAFHKEQADRVFAVGLALTVMTGLLLFLALSFWGVAYLMAFGPRQAVLFHARDYLHWIRYTALILPVNALLEGVVFADGDEGISTAASLVGGIGHILLSILLCQKFGTLGLGAAFFLSIGLSTLILLLHLFRKTNTLRLNVTFSPAIAWSIIKYSIVDASAYFFMALFIALMNRYVAEAFGMKVLVIVSAIALMKEVQLLFDGIGEAITPIISVYLGEETYPGVREVWRLAGLTSLFESLVVTTAIIAASPMIVRFLGIRDPVLAGQTVTGIRMLAVTLVFSCRMFLDTSYYILVNKMALGVLVCAFRDLVFSFPMALAGGRLGGIVGMFTGLMLAPPVAYAASCLYIRIRYGPNNYPLFLAGKEPDKKTELYEFEVTPETIAHTRDQIEETLRQHSYSKRMINRVMLLFEEVFMSIYEANKGQKVLAECSLVMGRQIRIITKDDGQVLDMADADRKVESLRSYTLSNLIASTTSKRVHYLTLSYNRNAFEIDQGDGPLDRSRGPSP